MIIDGLFLLIAVTIIGFILGIKSQRDKSKIMIAEGIVKLDQKKKEVSGEIDSLNNDELAARGNSLFRK